MDVSISELLMSVRLQTPRMLLRPLCAQDRDEFIRVYQVSKSSFEPWLPTGMLNQPFDQLFEQQLNRCIEGARQGTQCRLVGLLDDSRIVGFFNLSEIVRGAFQNAYASWSVSADVTGSGLGTEGAQALLGLAFFPSSASSSPSSQGLGLHRVQANIIPSNRASIRIAEKVGFRYEGLAWRYLHIGGAWQDHAMYAKLADEPSDGTTAEEA